MRDRGQGFQNAADEAGNFEFVATQSADWSRSKAQELVQNLIQSKGKDGFDAIYAQNDEMALGAGLALQQAGLTVNKDVFLVGVDGMKEAFDAIKSGKFSASVTCTPKFAGRFSTRLKQELLGSQFPGRLPYTTHWLIKPTSKPSTISASEAVAAQHSRNETFSKA